MLRVCLERTIFFRARIWILIPVYLNMDVSRGLSQDDKEKKRYTIGCHRFLTQVLGQREHIFFCIIYQNQYFSHTQQQLGPCAKKKANTCTLSLQLINAT